MQKNYGNDGTGLFRVWQQQLQDASTKTEEQKLQLINNFFNRHIRWGDDRLLWKKPDYWSTPLETMGLRAGDCEDFTIAKYSSLLALGVPRKKLRLIYVRAQLGTTARPKYQAHMVLGYYRHPNATPLILDNIEMNIKSASERSDLKPVFSFNSNGLWVGGQSKKQDPTARLSRWRDVLTRMQQQGLGRQ